MDKPLERCPRWVVDQLAAALAHCGDAWLSPFMAAAAAAQDGVAAALRLDTPEGRTIRGLWLSQRVAAADAQCVREWFAGQDSRSAPVDGLVRLSMPLVVRQYGAVASLDVAVRAVDGAPAPVPALEHLAEGVAEALWNRTLLHQLAEVGDESRFPAIGKTGAPLGIFQADARGGFFFVSGRWQDLCALPPERAMGDGWLDAIEERERGVVRATWQQAVAGRAPFDMEFHVHRPDGAPAAIRMQARPASWGDPVRQGWTGVVADITGRKATERELRRAKGFLERAELLTGVGGWEADLRARTVRWTEQNARIYELPPGHQPSYTEHRAYFSAEALRVMDAAARRAIEDAEPWDLELPMTTAKGRAIWVRSVGHVEFDDAGAARMLGALQDVTEAKTNREALEAANVLLRRVIEHLPCAVSVVDGDMRLVAHNRMFRDLLGFPDEMFYGPLTFEDLVRYNLGRGEYGEHPEDPEGIVRRIVADAREPGTESVERTRPNGQVLEIRGAPMPGGGFVRTYTDVTQARTAQAALRQSEERQARAMEASQIALWDYDLRSGTVYLSENWSLMRGGPAASTVTTLRELVELTPAEEREAISAAVAAMVDGTKPHYHFQHRVKRLDAGEIWIHSEGRVVERDAQGRPMRATGTNQDITVRRMAEIQLARGAAVTRATLEATADGILVMDANRNVLLFNSKFLEMWRIPADLETDDKLAILRYVQGQLKDPKAFAERVEQLHVLPISDDVDLLEFADGRIFERYARPMLLRGEAIGRVWSFRDVTQRHRAEAQVREAKDAAEAANRAKSDFLHNVNHEIRTPLNGVIGMLRLLTGTTLDERQRRYVELAGSSGDALGALIDDLLDLGKIEAGKLELEAIEFGVQDLLAEMTELFRLRAREKDLGFVDRIAPDLPRVKGDPLRLRQILGNLLSNALKFTDRGSFGLSAEWKPGGPGRVRMVFVVSDTGIGIPQAQLPRIFERFSQAGSAVPRRYGGTGLGLAIVHELCRLMGGSISVRSTVGRGTEFECELPFTVADAPSSFVPAAVLSSQSRAAPLRILVAEDDPVNRVVIHGLLEQAGYRDVVVVEDGAKAVEAARSARFDVVLMDCLMPVMNGFDATASLRTNGFRGPIFAVTATASPAERQRCLDSGMNDVLLKPVDPDALVRVLSRIDTGNGSFDPARLSRQLGGSVPLMRTALETFREVGPQAIRDLEAALLAGSREQVRARLHTLTGSTGMLGFAELSELSRSLHDVSATGPLDPIGQELPRIRTLVQQFIDASMEWLARQDAATGKSAAPG